MIVCIAEKPSVARDLAQILGAKDRKDGFFEGNGFQVTWTIGHLCGLKDPEDYSTNLKYWKLEDLPIIPEKFEIKLINNQGTMRQFEVIKNLVQQASEIINCGDAGQEGELIQRWVLLQAKNKVPVRRLWISSLTEEAIREGFQKLRPAKDFDRLFFAGYSRAVGDWLLGINGTRLYTQKFGKGQIMFSVGRVQTPTLAMIVQRQKEIDAFKSETYFELKTIFREVEFLAQFKNRLTEEERAKKGLEYLKDKPFVVTQFEQKEGKEGNPRLFDLTSLQVEANKRYAMSADETLKHIQSLYEKKLVTYPRVDTTYLPEDMHPKVPNILNGLRDYTRFTTTLLQAPIPKSKTVFDDKKITDHHAIIPTGIAPSGITPEEQKIYDLVARRFIAAFYPPATVSNTTVLGKVGDVVFKTTGKQILDKGWQIVYDDWKEQRKEARKGKKDEEEKVLPIFTVDESGPHEPFIHVGKTASPKPYTEATLLRAMETAGKLVEDEEMRDLMKENGIGRPSTRANIIETLFKRKYIERKKKNIHPTPTGIQLIDTIKNEILKSPELTGQWEYKLRQIEKGELEPKNFIQELGKMVREMTDDVIFNRN
jgi:DNA topoisomerase III